MRNADHICELLTPILPQQALAYVESPRYLMQIKEDGIRLVIERYMGALYGYDRKGQITNIPECVRRGFEQLAASECEDFMLDGELVDGVYIAWDILRVDEEDLRAEPYGTRFDLLTAFCESAPLTVQVVASWEDAAKAAALLAVAGTAEGVCFKDTLAVWQPGRAHQHFKLKFWESATCRVGNKALRVDKREERHSIALEMLSPGGFWEPMGFVTIPNARELPRVGQFVEVRYLYAQISGIPAAAGLYQPVFIMERTDVDSADCGIEQLKWKTKRQAFAEVA